MAHQVPLNYIYTAEREPGMHRGDVLALLSALSSGSLLGPVQSPVKQLHYLHFFLFESYEIW